MICFAILAKQKEAILPLWLAHIECWDYPKADIALYIKANNCTDKTKEILQSWIEKNTHLYHSVHIDFYDLPIALESFGVHEWNSIRFKALGKIRQNSIEYALKINADFYLVVDVDNFLLPHTVRKLVSYNLPVVAPLLVNADERNAYSNFHFAVNGLILCDVVHCSYLIRKDILPYVKYADDLTDYEYVIFSRFLRNRSVPQFLDNTEIGGCLTLTENRKKVSEIFIELIRNIPRNPSVQGDTQTQNQENTKLE